MEIGKTLYVADRKAWRRWLSSHHDKEKDIWLIYPKKHSGKPRIGYGDAVEIALCFGWIDSIVKKIDEDSFAQRFSPRKSASKWSQPNIERMRRLIELGEMTPAGLAVLKNKELLETEQSLEIPPDILKALQEDVEVWNNFEKFPGSYKRIRIAYIEEGKNPGHKPDEFQRRLRNFINKTRENKQFAFGGVQS